MPDAPGSNGKFQMAGCRGAILSGPVAESIEQQIRAIENALDSVPDFAFDLSKTLVESVCKTVLADIGQPADPNWDCPRIVKETTNRLSLLPRDHPDPGRARESVEKTIRGLLQTIQGLCELRNQHGMASHGRDAHAGRMDLRQAMLAAQAADTIVSFLYRIHRDALTRTPGARVYYEDHADFNQDFDEKAGPIQLGTLVLQASRVLFHADREAYKAALNEFLTDSDDDGDAEPATDAAPEAGA
jgi:hypothetical protein